MGAGRARFVAGSILGGLLLAVLATPAAAACALTAPDYVNVGTPITIEGAGFPASTTVDLTLSIDGGASDEFTLQSDATGAVHLAFTPEDLDIGVTTIQATAGSACTAEVTSTVLAAGVTPPPATPADDSGTGAAPGAPRTDADAAMTPLGAPSLGPWALALALVGAGSLGLLLTRPPKRR